ncbi:PQQ-dependent sugar dehydrogenase [Cohnella faecalis]|uniref:PQQ-dependent sugar dehydrogenase n=1 Tax=Cohnella faecalis TaxID=2315694 RepID=UPI0018F6D5C7
MHRKSNVIYRATPAYDSDLHYGSRIFLTKKEPLFQYGRAFRFGNKATGAIACFFIGQNHTYYRDGKPTTENAFAKIPKARPEIYSYVIEMCRVSASSVTEICGDRNGSAWRDELNRIVAGKNYGCPSLHMYRIRRKKRSRDGKNTDGRNEQPFTTGIRSFAKRNDIL